MAHGRPALLRLRDRRLAAGRARRQLAGRRPGTRTPAFDSVTPARLAARGRSRWSWLLDLLGLPAGLRRRVRHRRHHGQLQPRSPRPGTPCSRGGLGRRGRRALRRAADHGRDRRGGAPHAVSRRSGLLGLGRNRVVRVPVDGQGRMRADALPALAGPTIVCAQAGNVNTGAFDPLPGRSPSARATAGAWVHVDGAFGLWAAGGARAARTSPAGSSWPTPGRPTRTSGSTCRTTAASRSCATPTRCAPRWP